ncbi:MAG: hypothetical protein KBT20_11665 [Bacteroidales bacterium]|nr:hypothetical protein [Candidatus Liminaster caballi]
MILLDSVSAVVVIVFAMLTCKHNLPITATSITHADVNKDNAITVADLAAVASMILGAE